MGIKRDLDRFRVAGAPGAHGLVGGRVFGASRIASNHPGHSRDVLEHRLNTPKTAASDHSGLRAIIVRHRVEARRRNQGRSRCARKTQREAHADRRKGCDVSPPRPRPPHRCCHAHDGCLHANRDQKHARPAQALGLPLSSPRRRSAANLAHRLGCRAEALRHPFSHFCVTHAGSRQTGDLRMKVRWRKREFFGAALRRAGAIAVRNCAHATKPPFRSRVLGPSLAHCFWPWRRAGRRDAAGG